MVLVWSCYKCKTKTKNKLAGENSLISGYGSRYKAVCLSASYSRYKGKVEYSIAAYKRRGLN